MTKIHINPKTGDPSACRSVKGNCPFGGAEEHYTSKDAALKAYEKKFADVPAPAYDGSSIRFQELTSPLELQKLANQLKTKFDYKPTTRIKIQDRNAYGLGVTNISFDVASKEFVVSKRRMGADQIFFKNKSLVDTLSYSALAEGYSDDQYDPIDWDS